MTPDIDTILARERAVWQALVDGDAAADAALLTADFLGVYASGFAGRADHVGQLADGPTVRSFELREARLVPLAEGLVLLSYRADWVRANGAVDAAYISSIWREVDGVWVNLFSQDTAAS